jgi:hypothetical protein
MTISGTDVCGSGYRYEDHCFIHSLYEMDVNMAEKMGVASKKPSSQ